MGRCSRHTSPDFSGKLVLRRIPLNSGGYDRLGTYFGLGGPLYWYAFHDKGRIIIDAMLRAEDREDAKHQIRVRYPNAKFFA
jgi:hypothetical protein